MRGFPSTRVPITSPPVKPVKGSTILVKNVSNLPPKGTWSDPRSIPRTSEPRTTTGVKYKNTKTATKSHSALPSKTKAVDPMVKKNGNPPSTVKATSLISSIPSTEKIAKKMSSMNPKYIKWAGIALASIVGLFLLKKMFGGKIGKSKIK